MVWLALAFIAAFGVVLVYAYFSAQREQRERALPPPAEHDGRLRVLVVDDSALIQKFTCGLVRGLGHEAEAVADGPSAIEAVRKGNYDVILMDILMPDMDGLEATRRIRSLPELQKQPWIIAMTGSETGSDRQECLGAGMNDYLQKPLDSAILKSALQRRTEPKARGPGDVAASS